MSFTPEIYKQASYEHVHAARGLYSARHYVLAHYVAGLAVECLLRSFIEPHSEFDQKHDLRKLAKSGRLFDRFPPGDSRQDNEKRIFLTEAFNEVVYRWENAHRFRSLSALRSLLKERKLDRGKKMTGDFVKESSRRIVDGAANLVGYFFGERK